MVQAILPLMLPALLASTPPADVVQARARIDDKLDVGSTATLHIDIRMKEGWSIDKAGISNAIVQIDAPDCVALQGERARNARDLARAGFIRHPEEQIAKDGKATFEFKVVSACGNDDVLTANILAYVSPPDGSDAWFVRQRIAIPIKANATSHSIATDTSDWGVGDELQVGDKAPLMSLPRADGKRVDLAEHLGKKNIVITTYRAHW